MPRLRMVCMFGINGTEFIIIMLVVLIVIGPQRMPEYAAQLRDFVKAARKQIVSLRDSVQDEMGDDFKDVDWQKFDPRQYDPRRIVREALMEDDEPQPSDDRPLEPMRLSPLQRYSEQASQRDTSMPAPFDPEAT